MIEKLCFMLQFLLIGTTFCNLTVLFLIDNVNAYQLHVQFQTLFGLHLLNSDVSAYQFLSDQTVQTVGEGTIQFGQFSPKIM